MDDIEIHRIDHRSSDAVIALFEAQLREHQITVSTKSLREAVSIVVDNPRYGFILLAMAQDGAAVGVRLCEFSIEPRTWWTKRLVRRALCQAFVARTRDWFMPAATGH
jgi:hypothetical protein